jgi:hypothetical protein
MIISTNQEPSLDDFKSLLDDATLRLNDDAKKRSDYYLKRNGQLLEDDVKDILDKAAKNTRFEGTIEKISGQRFPDIVAKKFYGVEVKSSKDTKWTTLGGSINESTRIEDVKRIFLIFGKLLCPIEFRNRPYEECLSDVVVTHYPRYKIDMNLSTGKTIFDRMKISYDDLRLSDDPVGKVVDYYKSQLSDGEGLWWTGDTTTDEKSVSFPMKIRFWSTLSVEEKKELESTGFALFPDLLSNSNTKYESFALWLATNHGVISTSLRDIFSAGGQGDITIQSDNFDRVPRILVNVYKNHADISQIILNTDKSVLCETWCVKEINDDRISQWIDCASRVCTLQNHDVKVILNTIFKETTS